MHFKANLLKTTEKICGISKDFVLAAHGNFHVPAILYCGLIPWMNYSLNLETGKKYLKGKGLRVNMGKIKVMISEKNFQLVRGSGKHPCGVCCNGCQK